MADAKERCCERMKPGGICLEPHNLRISLLKTEQAGEHYALRPLLCSAKFEALLRHSRFPAKNSHNFLS